MKTQQPLDPTTRHVLSDNEELEIEETVIDGSNYQEGSWKWITPPTAELLLMLGFTEDDFLDEMIGKISRGG